jgi:hypothetical protein
LSPVTQNVPVVTVLASMSGRRANALMVVQPGSFSLKSKLGFVVSVGFPMYMAVVLVCGSEPSSVTYKVEPVKFSHTFTEI